MKRSFNQKLRDRISRLMYQALGGTIARRLMVLEDEVESLKQDRINLIELVRKTQQQVNLLQDELATVNQYLQVRNSPSTDMVNQLDKQLTRLWQNYNGDKNHWSLLERQLQQQQQAQQQLQRQLVELAALHAPQSQLTR